MKKIFLILLLFLFVFFGKVNASEVTFTRKEMQDMILSTAVSYLNNKAYSDYDQKSMDATLQLLGSGTINWRNFSVSPEMVNRTHNFSIDCSSFVNIVYYYTFGYNFNESKYRNLSSTKYVDFNESSNVFETIRMKTSYDTYQNGYNYFGRGTSTTLFEKIGENAASGVSSGSAFTSKSDMVAFYYKVTGNESSTQKSNIIKQVKNTLQKGDILVYRRYKNTNRDSTSGHAMLYVGDLFDTENGFIHSTGSDYLNEDGSFNTSGNDSHSIRYDNLNRIDKYFFSSSSPSISFTILRPLNNYCGSGTSCKIDSSKINGNTYARRDLNGLRTEQYISKLSPSIIHNLDSTITDYKVSSTKFSSVNVGDEIQYNLYLQNNSKIGFCFGNEGGKYTSSSACKNAGLTWKTSIQETKSYNGTVLTATIPANTTYVSGSCNYGCSYNSNNKTITWKINSSYPVNSSKSPTLLFKVKVSGGSSIKFSGFNVKSSSGNTLNMPDLIINVNPTLNKININSFKTEINKFKNNLSNGKIKYNASSGVHKFDLDDFSSANVTASGFVKTIYYNTLGIDLGFLNGNEVKNAIFNNDGTDNFAKKTDSQINSMSISSNSFKINKMLVKGFYGGRYLRGNDNKDREGRLRVTDLQAGDIIFYYTKSNGKNAGLSTIMTYLGKYESDNDDYHFIRFTSDNKITMYNQSTSKKASVIFEELWSKDLFVVLRPTQLFGTTVSYSGGTISGKNNSVEYDTYRNLKDLTSSKSFTVTLEYNKTGYTCDGCKTSYTGGNTFGGWYSDPKYTNQVKNGSKLASNTDHTLYSKWIKDNLKLPSATITGYSIEGWYSNSSLTTKVGNVNTDYKMSSTTTLYAKWVPNSYKVKYNANGGTGTMSDSNHVYDETSSLSTNKFTKSGYVFDGWSNTKTGSVKYKDGAGVKNLTSVKDGSVTLYAIWRVKENDEFNVKINVKNGTADALQKTVKKGNSVTFSLTPNKGYSNGKLTCESGTFLNNKLTITNVSKDLSCTIGYSGITYKVIYNSNGGSGSMDSSSHVYGTSKRLSENLFIRKGYDFKGWSTTKEGSIKYSDNENVLNLTANSSINLYAIWNIKNYSISYNLNGGVLENKISSYRVTSNDIEIGIPKKEGYRFIGWTTDEDDTKNKNVIIKKGSTGNKKYTAHYEIGNYLITYKSDKYGKITGITDEIIEYKGNPSGTTKSVNTNYLDLKWAVDKDVKLKDGTIILSGDAISEKQIKEIVVSDDLVITAYHYVKKYNVKYNSGNNGSISGINSEEVGYSSNPLGTKVSSNRGYKFKAWTANKNVKLNNGKTIKKGTYINDLKSVIISEEIEFTPVFEVGSFNISYQSDEFGYIDGKDTEIKTYPNVISNREVKSINENYEFAYWTSNIDVVLNNDRIIKKNDPITKEEISLIVADSNMILTAHHKQVLFNIYYFGYEDIIVSDNIKEVVSESKNIVGPVYEGKNGKEIVFVSDIDVVLNDGKTIKAGKAISMDEVKNIKLTCDLNLTLRYKNDISIFNFNIIYIAFGVLGFIGLIILISKLFKKKNDKNNKNSHPSNFGSNKKKFSLYKDYYN